MSYTRLANGIDRLTDSKLVEFCTNVHGCISTKTSRFTNPTPTMAELLEVIEEFRAAVSAALTRDTNMVAQKRLKRQALIDLTHKVGYYVLFVSGGDPEVIAEGGFKAAKEPTPRLISKPENFKIEATDQPGELVVSVFGQKGVAGYLHEYSTEPDMKPEFKKTMSCTAARCLITGLTPGTLYYFRVTAMGTKDQLKMSDVVSRMAA